MWWREFLKLLQQEAPQRVCGMKSEQPRSATTVHSSTDNRKISHLVVVIRQEIRQPKATGYGGGVMV
ncbi:hypothetical protein L2E82_16533 [Cichorium intybus]|uniref:Uncharacterized protein n=1 Tax=Cichorium intybus TaxID=13427 RepID=A0ACB9F6T1_CICIN|nr:hypothetical protein L2E82_16533 [Cichorium intybus]